MKVVVVGAGGHARSVLDALQGGEHVAVALTDPRPELHGQDLDGVPIVGGDEQLMVLRQQGVEGAVLGVGGVLDQRPRAQLLELAGGLGFALPVIVHPAASVSRRAAIGEGSVVLAGAVVGPGAALGRGVIVNTGAIVEHDCRIGDHVHAASGAVIGGGVTVGALTHVGLGAAVIHGVTIGESVLVAAGAVVVGDVRGGQTVLGVPARERTV